MMSRVILVCLLVLSLGSLVIVVRSNGGISRSNTKLPLARIGNQAIYEEDLLPLIQPELKKLEHQAYEFRRQALDQLVQHRLLSEAANQRGLTVEQMLQNVTSEVPDPSDEEVGSLYRAQEKNINRPLNEVKDQLRQMLKQSRSQEAVQRFHQRLRTDAGVELLLEPPRQDIKSDPSRIRGSKGAPITIVEFSDFQCPFCLRAYSVVKQIMTKYGDRVNVSYRDFPLREIHPNAQAGAQAARCAGDQGKYWEYHDMLFENFGKLDRDSLIAHAASLELSSEEFVKCLDSGKFDGEIEQDIRDGRNAGITGTPAFFINGVFLNGAQPAAAFEEIINRELNSPRHR